MMMMQYVYFVIISLVVVIPSSSTTDSSYAVTSWNDPDLSVKIPRNFPLHIPIVKLLLLEPPEAVPSDEGDAEIFNPSGSSGGIGDETLGELRLPPHAEGGGGGGGGRGGGNLMGDLGYGSGRREPEYPRKRSMIPKMILLSNPNNMFHSVIQEPQGNTISLRLQRNLDLTDFVAHGSKQKDITVKIGPETSQAFGGGVRPGKWNQIITIRITVGENISCQQLRRNACMLPEGTIKLQQFENRNSNALFSLASVVDICPNAKPSYSITIKEPEDLSGITLLKTSNDRLSIKPVIFDREKYGSKVKFTVTCSIQVGDRNIKNHRDGKLKIIDEDDSHPITLKNRVVNWHYSNRTADLDDQMMVLDPDMRDTNKYEIMLMGNTFNMVTIDSINKFQIRKERCDIEARNITGYSFHAECMLLTPVMLLEDVNMRKNSPPKIEFKVVIIDKSLIIKDPNNSRQVEYDVVLSLPPCEEDVSPKWNKIASVIPTMEANVSVIKPVNRFYRLGQLVSPSLSYHDLSLKPPTTINFSLDPKSQNMGVGITRFNGILYVDNPDQLTEGDIIVHRGNTTISVYMSVTTSVETSSCSSLDPSEDIEWCSSKGYNTTCQSSCGVGSSKSCMWRAPQQPPDDKLYATCSPDLNTCPDGICDELEIMHEGICPQDCIVYVKGGDNFVGELYATFGSGDRGIQSCRTLFTCEDEKRCVCSPSQPEQDEGDVVQKKAPVPSPGCDSACQIGVTLCGIIFILVIGFCAFIYTRRAINSNKQKGGVISLGTLPVEERSQLGYTRDEPHDTVHHGIRSSPRPDHNNFVPTLNVTQVDQKWEFPRNRLVIEQTLGEGEFGKVMRAKAQGINGTLGYTTVAVKMLKPNSTPLELNDLLSEYSLLKEVSHPNVVKLLGACTAKGGPIYIIIEYCHYGSLRNYLKRSRHAEFENRVGSGPSDGSTEDYSVTPKEILSFAWQISKGMAYLTDMKLVHRDLAARNVLLAAGKVCKISDFGLTRDVYEGDLYFKRSKGRVPVKWMALESLVDHVYTSKSDVWGFGVLLWELVTLGTLPYPGVQPERLFTLLKAGYRMERPENCSPQLYDVMLQCWAEDPNRRPCFQDLTEVFEGMIQADVEYLELRSLIVTNRSYFDTAPLVLPEPPQQFQDDPPEIQVASVQANYLGNSFQDTSDTSPDSSPQMEDLHNPELDWSPPSGQTDEDAYLVARTDIKRPRREESTEPLIASITPTSLRAGRAPRITTSHAHNPAYSPTSEMLAQSLNYSTLATRPDEEDSHTLECCRSEEDSDSGRATGDSGYATEEGRGRWKVDHKGSSRAPLASPRGSYSPIPHHGQDPEDDQDTSEDLEERQELLNEDLLGHLTPSPEPAHTAHSTRTAHANHHAAHKSHHHTTPVIV